MSAWTASDIPSLHGRSAVVTGNRGLGFETALALARAGCEIILAGRDPGKGAEAVAKLRGAVPAARTSFEVLDLASLRSVATFAARLTTQRERLDLLVNNAGVMRPPKRLTTEDGFELQFGTNYLGHFALTAHLLPLLRKSGARVVTLSSVAARGGAINFDDLQSEQRYESMPAYAQSKLACLMFAFELQRRSAAGRWGVSSVAAHPGLSRTDLLRSAPGRNGRIGIVMSLLQRLLMQSAADGAMPTLYAATSLRAAPGGYYGPDRMSETRGAPAPAKPPARSLDEVTAARLWRVSEHLAGVSFEPSRAAVGSTQ